MRRRFAWTVACAAAIFVVGGASGLLANAVSGTGIPLIAERASPGRSISLSDAHALLEDDDARFVDARPRAEFLAGHVAGALSVPFASRADRLDALRRELPRTRQLIVYCDGGGCASAVELSAWFAANGWRRVRVLGDGYPVWEAAGFPVAQGEER